MPIFIIGTQRSGSNLLRLMLNQLPEIVAPHPPHIMQRMMPLVKNYGDLGDDRNFYDLVDDICQLVELNPVKWEGVILDRNFILSHCKKRSVMAIQEVVYDLIRDKWGGKDWCCKSMENVKYLSEIEGHIGERAKYIYLYRDGRDVAVSFTKAVVGEKHYYYLAKDWAATQEIAMEFGSTVGTGRFYAIRYEELIANTEATMQGLCEFLNIPYSNTMFDFYKSIEAKRAAESSKLWGNVTNPVVKTNSRKFLTEAAEENIRIFESVAGHVLDMLGYSRSFVNTGSEQEFTNDEIRLFDLENTRLKEEAMQSVDSGDLDRRRQQDQLLKRIKERALTVQL